jgi:lipoprotein-anchoring transpeptidase ErfK/SrfK
MLLGRKAESKGEGIQKALASTFASHCRSNFAVPACPTAISLPAPFNPPHQKVHPSMQVIIAKDIAPTAARDQTLRHLYIPLRRAESHRDGGVGTE